jgi:malonyl-CoA O-methyltransferase
MTREIDKSLVASRFGKRAASYEVVTPVQKFMAHYLADAARDDCPPENVHRILELGCGTGRLTRMLREYYPAAKITSIDISPAMVDLASKNCPNVDFVTADAEEYVRGRLAKYDLIISSAAMQWFQQPQTTLPLYRNLLGENGLLALSTFGNETFQELKSAFTHAYKIADKPYQRHLGELPDLQFWRQLLPESKIIEQRFCMDFPDVRCFLRSIQEAGATNSFEKKTYIPRNILKEMLDFYERSYPAANGAGIYCTYHAVFIFCRGTRG